MLKSIKTSVVKTSAHCVLSIVEVETGVDPCAHFWKSFHICNDLQNSRKSIPDYFLPSKKYKNEKGQDAFFQNLDILVVLTSRKPLVLEASDEKEIKELKEANLNLN